ncbi:MAG: ATP-dependent sacrificial sulfur transferase LarE [Treponema sp.]|nr:ATP-dependent sacrificial sulfur transferase LarE [Treponema sp.]
MSDSSSKLLKLKEEISKYKKVAIAFSGGNSSTLLLKVAHDILGEKVVAVNVYSRIVSEKTVSECQAFCKKYGIEYNRICIDLFAFDNLKKNLTDRCYHCKKILYTAVIQEAANYNIDTILDCSVVHDRLEYNPGMRALRELNIVSPLKNLGFTKEDVKNCLNQMEIPVKKENPCFATRIEFGQELTFEKIEMVRKAEEFLFDHNLLDVHVKLDNNHARIVIDKNSIETFHGIQKSIYKEFKKIGFDYVTIDLDGYKMSALYKNVRLQE